MIFIFVAILAAAVLVLVHEFGHFMFAKILRIPVQQFTLGYGRPIAKFTRGGTIYGLGAFPLGGYVKIEGLDPREAELLPEEERAGFKVQPFWKRILVVSGGPLANILFAVFIFAAMFMIGVPSPTTTIDQVFPSSPAKQAGLKGGDKIVAVEHKRIETWEDIVKSIRLPNRSTMEIEVMRGGKRLKFVTKVVKRQGVNFIGIQIREAANPNRSNIFVALYQGFLSTILVTVSFVQALILVFSGRLPFRPVSPIGIVQITSQAARHGLITFLDFVGFVTIVLGVSNMLPILPLDGGRALLWVVERVKGSSVKTRTVVALQVIGVALLVVLVISALYLDIFRPLPNPFK